MHATLCFCTASMATSVGTYTRNFAACDRLGFCALVTPFICKWLICKPKRLHFFKSKNRPLPTSSTTLRLSVSFSDIVENMIQKKEKKRKEKTIPFLRKKKVMVERCNQDTKYETPRCRWHKRSLAAMHRSCEVV
jgi:hypothetical protein